VTSFERISNLGTQYFKRLFQDDGRANLDKIVRVLGYFPCYIEEEESINLME